MTKEKIVKDLHKVLNAVDITFPYRLELINAIEYLLESSLPSNIDEAAEEYVVKAGLQPEAFIVIPSFKAGAELMAGQEKTVKGYVSIRGKRSLIVVLDRLEKFKFGDEVIVQIRKKQ